MCENIVYFIVVYRLNYFLIYKIIKFTYYNFGQSEVPTLIQTQN